MTDLFIVSCDRKEGQTAILIRDGDEHEFTVRSPLSACLQEGGIYMCETDGERITKLIHLTNEEKRRREESLARISRLFTKK